MEVEPMTRSDGKPVEWRMSPDTYMRYIDFALTLGDAEPYSEEYHRTLDALKSLPGYPLDYDMESNEFLQPVIVAPIQSVVH